jgi:hypothetical protein
MPIKPSDQEEFNEQISGFFRREPSQAEAKRKLAAHSSDLLKSLPDMLGILPDYPIYAAMAFHGKFDWVDRRSITNLAAKNAPSVKALQEIRAKKALRVAASAKPGWDSLLQNSPDALWMAIQLNLAGWKVPVSAGQDEDEDEAYEDNNEDEENENESEY